MKIQLGVRSFLLATSTLAILFAQPPSAQAAKKEVAFVMPVPKAAGNPNAPQGGTFTMNLRAEPSTLNPVTGTDLYLTKIKEYIMDRLLIRDPETYEMIPSLAEKYDVSADGKTFTFTLRKGVKWHDGKPLTAEDVKFSYDVVFEPKYNAAHMRPYFEGIEKAEIVDPQTIRFTAKEKYFGNLALFAEDLWILPKHIFENPEAGLKKNRTMIGTGAYSIDRYDQGQTLMLVKNKEWWGKDVDYLKGKFNFERIRFRFIKDDNIAIEMLKKGDTDFDALRPEDYMKNTGSAEWGKTVNKYKVENLKPKSYGYTGWNQKRELFKDRDVRTALYMLMNRKEMISKFRFDMSLPATGPWYRQNPFADPSVKAVEYNPAKAVELLKKAGWTDSNKDGILDKTINGQRVDFRFTLNYGDQGSEKYHVLYQNDLKKVGIDMKMQLLEWNALLKSVDERNFDAAALAWGGGSVDVEPKQIWHSSMDTKGGSNYVGYNRPEVDKLIDEARGEMDSKKRIPMMRKIYKMIAEDVPYNFWFNDKFVLYARTARIGAVKPTLKYEEGAHYWWAIPQK